MFPHPQEQRWSQSLTPPFLASSTLAFYLVGTTDRESSHIGEATSNLLSLLFSRLSARMYKGKLEETNIHKGSLVAVAQAAASRQGTVLYVSEDCQVRHCFLHW